MSDKIVIHTGDLMAALDGLAERVIEGVKPVVAKGALNIKQGMQADLAASPYFKGVAPGVSYDTTVTKGAVEAEIGPDASRRKAANLANIAYFGGAHGGGGTVRDPQLVADEEEERFYDALDKVIGGLL